MKPGYKVKQELKKKHVTYVKETEFKEKQKLGMFTNTIVEKK